MMLTLEASKLAPDVDATGMNVFADRLEQHALYAEQRRLDSPLVSEQ